MHDVGNEGMSTLPGLNQIQFEGPVLLERSASKNPRVLNEHVDYIESKVRRNEQSMRTK